MKPLSGEFIEVPEKISWSRGLGLAVLVVGIWLLLWMGLFLSLGYAALIWFGG